MKHREKKEKKSAQSISDNFKEDHMIRVSKGEEEIILKKNNGKKYQKLVETINPQVQETQ